MILTIYTPTFNRKKLLCRLYNSLCKQTNKDFCWLIIDDGSTDGTCEIVRKWKTSSDFSIDYIYKENGGVHTARDKAYETVNTELIWGVDSDDWLVENAVEKVLDLWEEKGSSQYYGIFAPVKDVNETHPLIKYPSIESVKFQDLFYKYKAKGDQTIILRSEDIKAVKKFPVYENEKLVSESYKWIQLNKKNFLILNDFTTYVEYQENGYTKNVRIGYFKNINGYCDLYNEHVWHVKFIKKRISYCIKYIVTCFFAKKKNPCRKATRPFLTGILFPLGFFAFLFCKFKWRRIE